MSHSTLDASPSCARVSTSGRLITPPTVDDDDDDDDDDLVDDEVIFGLVDVLFGVCARALLLAVSV
jgi:hypothetical protein